MFQWIEVVRDELQPTNELIEDKGLVESPAEDEIELEETPVVNTTIVHECPTIVHGEVILDRKNSFQGHAATVKTIEQVQYVKKNPDFCQFYCIGLYSFFKSKIKLHILRKPYFQF